MATKQSENGQKKKAPAFSAKIDALCDTGSSTKAFASVCISGRFVVRDIAVMEAVLSAYQQELEQSEAEGLDESEDASEGMAPQM